MTRRVSWHADAKFSQVFDNNYYQLMVDEAPDGDRLCCGKILLYGCHRSGGRPTHLDTKKAHHPCKVPRAPLEAHGDSRKKEC